MCVCNKKNWSALWLCIIKSYFFLFSFTCHLIIYECTPTFFSAFVRFFWKPHFYHIFTALTFIYVNIVSREVYSQIHWWRYVIWYIHESNQSKNIIAKLTVYIVKLRVYKFTEYISFTHYHCPPIPLQFSVHSIWLPADFMFISQKNANLIICRLLI